MYTHKKRLLWMNSIHARQRKDLIALGGNIIATDVGRVKTRYV